jgi:hypothetical protein
MPRSVSLYLDDKDIAILDRLTRTERRSRSAMVGELIRRYAQIAEAEGLERHPLFRSFSAAELAQFLREDRKTSKQEVPELPTFRSGGALVDVADRDALYQAMEGR